MNNSKTKIPHTGTNNTRELYTSHSSGDPTEPSSSITTHLVHTQLTLSFYNRNNNQYTRNPLVWFYTSRSTRASRKYNTPRELMQHNWQLCEFTNCV